MVFCRNREDRAISKRWFEKIRPNYLFFIPAVDSIHNVVNWAEKTILSVLLFNFVYIRVIKKGSSSLHILKIFQNIPCPGYVQV